MSELIRIASGHITAVALAGDSSYLVTNFPRQSDMTASDAWLCYQASRADGELVQALGFTAQYVGGVSTTLEFMHLTYDQYQYLRSNLLNGRVTAYVRHRADDFQAYQGFLTETGDYDEAARGYSNIQFLFSRGVQV